MSATVLHGDCIEQMRGLADGSVDSVVTDPPYEIGMMGRSWDSTGIANSVEMWREAFRVLKPGGHLLAFSATRTQHRMVCAIEDAGFDVRDQIYWHYGTGFPKSLDVSKAIDKAAGAEREVVGEGPFASRRPNADHSKQGLTFADDAYVRPAGHAITAPATAQAQQWAGWGTALKPASEPICVARKPLSEGTVAANVLAHGTGALNIDACRVGTTRGVPASHSKTASSVGVVGIGANRLASELDPNIGRWPANCIHDGSDEVLEAFAAFGERTSGTRKAGSYTVAAGHGRYGEFGVGDMPAIEGSSGTAARFFYSAKANKTDRAGSKHPTVKPLNLMKYLVKLVTPPGGTVLDMFAGSGTTLQAAIEEGFTAIGIEREAEYHADILRRLEMARQAMEKPAPTPKAIRIAKPKPRKAPQTDHPTLFDLMMCESA